MCYFSIKKLKKKNRSSKCYSDSFVANVRPHSPESPAVVSMGLLKHTAASAPPVHPSFLSKGAVKGLGTRTRPGHLPGSESW